jgi:hypothetical protein
VDFYFSFNFIWNLINYFITNLINKIVLIFKSYLKFFHITILMQILCSWFYKRFSIFFYTYYKNRCKRKLHHKQFKTMKVKSLKNNKGVKNVNEMEMQHKHSRKFKTSNRLLLLTSTANNVDSAILMWIS